MFSALALLLVLRHFCYVGRHVFVQYCTVPSGTYYVVSLSFSIEVYVGKYLYVVYMNKMIREIKSTQLCYVIYTDKHLYDKNLNNE